MKRVRFMVFCFRITKIRSLAFLYSVSLALNMLGRQILFLIEKELRSEWKQKYAFGGMLLYVVSTVFICRQCFDTIKDPLTWGALYWIILLFADRTSTRLNSSHRT